MKKYIIVTGGAGFVGSNLIEFLIKNSNYKIISLDNYSSGSKKNHIKNRRIRYINGDTNQIDLIFKKLKKKILTIFHFGEFARIHQSFFNLNECINSNIRGTARVLNFCLENKIKLIYSATSASLGNKGFDQDLSPYAFTKAKNLQLIVRLNKWFRLSYEVLYFYNVYGPKQIKKGSMSTVIGIFEDQYLKNKSLTVVKPGTQSRKFTHISDTVKGCFYAWKKNKNRHYSLSNAKSYTMLEVAKMFSSNIRMVRPRLGERHKSSLVVKVGSTKIYKYPCITNLKDYIFSFKKNCNKN